MADRFQGHSGGMSGPAEIHQTITPSNTVDIPNRPRALKVLTDGALVIVDMNDTAISYPVKAGEVITFRAKRINATGTTATVVGWE